MWRGDMLEDDLRSPTHRWHGHSPGVEVRALFQKLSEGVYA